MKNYLMMIVMMLMGAMAFAQDVAQKDMGGISPEKALEYMETTENLVIVDVREPQYINSYFEGSIRIPWTQMDKRYNEIPKDRPVLINCGMGQVAPRAYEILKKNRPDIPALGYIAGVPKFREYNNWLKQQKKKSDD